MIPPIWHIGSTRRRHERSQLERHLTEEEKDVVDAAGIATRHMLYLGGALCVATLLYLVVKYTPTDCSWPNVYSP